MAVPSVRKQVKNSLFAQLRTALNVEKNSEIPRKLSQMVEAYMRFYDQYWTMSGVLEELDPTSKDYRELSKERRQVHNAMLTTLEYFDGLSGPTTAGGAIDWEGLL